MGERLLKEKQLTLFARASYCSCAAHHSWWVLGSLESAGIATRIVPDHLLGEVCLLPRPNEVFRLSHGVLFPLRAASIWRRPVAAAVTGCPAAPVPGPPSSDLCDQCLRGERWSCVPPVVVQVEPEPEEKL